MNYPRFSLTGLSAFIAIIAIGLAALCRPSCLWASAMFSLFMLSLAVSCLWMFLRRGRERAFWVGFLSCGSLYAILSQAPWFDSHVSHRLFTTVILDLIYPKIPLLENSNGRYTDAWTSWTQAPPDYSYAHPRIGFTQGSTDQYQKNRAFFTVNTTDAFLLIGHSLFGIIFAVAGGCLARMGYQQSERNGSRATLDSSTS
jgi:hypothetical protein